MRAAHLLGWLIVAVLSVVGAGAAARSLPLVEAAKRADVANVRALLKQGVNVNTAEPDGTTALHWAADRNQLEVMTLLVRAGANVKAANRLGMTPLAVACTTGTGAMVELLLTAGADPNAASAEGETALMTAALAGKVDVIRVLLAHGADVNVDEKWKGQTALMWAAAEGHAEAVKLMVEAGANVKARSNTGYTPILFAVREGHSDVVRLLVNAGASPQDRLVKGSTKNELAPVPSGTQASSTRDGDTTPALSLAIINGHYELAALLLEQGADPNAFDARGSALHSLAWMRRPGLPQGRINVPPPQTGRLDSLELAKLLLAKGANPNARIDWKEQRFDRDDGEIRNPPDISVGRGFISYVGATPFYLAAKHADVDFMRVLVANGADPNLPTLQKVTPLMAAAGFGFWDGESPSSLSGAGVPENERLAAVKLTVELGADVNEVTDFGDVPIKGDPMDLFYRYPDNLLEFPETALGDMRWSGGNSLHAAAVLSESPEKMSIIEFLVEKGARLDAKTKLGWTPLMIAEGVLAGGGNPRDSPQAIELFRRLMRERNLDPASYSQPRPLRLRTQ
jgi:ankyrin repeat protein